MLLKRSMRSMRSMRSSWKPVLFLLLVLVAVVAAPRGALAAGLGPLAADPPTGLPPVVSNFVLGVILAATPVASWLFVWLAKKFLSGIPPLVKIGLATLLGFLLPLIPQIHVGGGAAWVIYPLLSVAAVALDQVQKYLRGELPA